MFLKSMGYHLGQISLKLTLNKYMVGIPNVISVFESKERQLHTTRSWDFLGLETQETVPSDSIWNVTRFGEDAIIANFDTGSIFFVLCLCFFVRTMLVLCFSLTLCNWNIGVWPESKSLSDEGYGPIPSRWLGSCQSGSHPNFRCNRSRASIYPIYISFSSIMVEYI